MTPGYLLDIILRSIDVTCVKNTISYNIKSLLTPICILAYTINTTVLTRIAFSTDTIVPAESSYIHCFNPINLYPLVGYNRIINQNMIIIQ